MQKHNLGNLIYRSKETDSQPRTISLMARTCLVEYYTVHELEPIDVIVSELLLQADDEQMSCADMGQILGFDIIDQPEDGLYFDEAEDHLFQKLLLSVQEWGIISIDEEEKTLALTNLGRKCLQNKEKYRFHEGRADVLEFRSLKNADNQAVRQYPFLSELGIDFSLTEEKTLDYAADATNSIGCAPANNLVECLRWQAPNDVCIYKAESASLASLKPITLDVELYERDGRYTLNFTREGKSCVRLNALYELCINAEAKDRKVEHCLYRRLMNDPNAALDYHAIKPFEDIVELADIISDPRIVWTDSQLLQFIVPQCDADMWHSLSCHCDVEVLKTLIPNHIQDLDWGALTIRLDSQFIQANSRQYPWDKSAILARPSVDKELVQQMLLAHEFPDGKDDGAWDWEEVMPVVGQDFVLSHLADIPFNLYEVTRELEHAPQDRDAVLHNPNANWDWDFISAEYPVDFIVGNMKLLRPHVSMQTVVERIFKDRSLAETYAGSPQLKDAIVASELNELLNANCDDFVWTDGVIELFEECGLISWPTTQNKAGFELNPHLTWNAAFFRRHHAKVTTQDGFNRVSENIVDPTLVDEFPDFKWSSIGLSRNAQIRDNIPFIAAHWDALNAETLVLTCNNATLQGLFELLTQKSAVRQLIDGRQDIQTRLLSNLRTETILRNYADGWDATLFTKWVAKNVNLATLVGQPWSSMLDWDLLTENLNIADIKTHFATYANKWNYTLLTKRISGKELLTGDFLEAYANAISKQDIREELWNSITGKFSAGELIELVERYAGEPYQWDYPLMYNLPNFPTREYLEGHANSIHWKEFSKSEAVNTMFAKVNAKSWSLRQRTLREALENPQYRWDYGELSRLPNLIDWPGWPNLFKIDKPWDWSYISEHATWISTQQGRDGYFKSFAAELNFKKLSARTDIGLTESVIEKYDKRWDWDALMRNSSVHFSLDFIKSHNDKPWNWKAISLTGGLTIDVVRKLNDKDWDWEALSQHNELTFEVVSELKDKPWDWKALSQRGGLTFNVVSELQDKDWDWQYISSRDWFKPDKDMLDFITSRDPLIELDWNAISRNGVITANNLETYEDKINWRSFTEYNPEFTKFANVNFLRRYESRMPWAECNKRLGSNITTEMLLAFPNRLDWRNVSMSQNKVRLRLAGLHQLFPAGVPRP